MNDMTLKQDDRDEAIRVMADKMEAVARCTGPFAYWIQGDKTALATRALEALEERFTLEKLL